MCPCTAHDLQTLTATDPYIKVTARGQAPSLSTGGGGGTIGLFLLQQQGVGWDTHRISKRYTGPSSGSRGQALPRTVL